MLKIHIAPSEHAIMVKDGSNPVLTTSLDNLGLYEAQCFIRRTLRERAAIRKQLKATRPKLHLRF